jgi:hypothetical protein
VQIVRFFGVCACTSQTDGTFPEQRNEQLQLELTYISRGYGKCRIGVDGKCEVNVLHLGRLHTYIHTYVHTNARLYVVNFHILKS